jgi:hypothetical protein
VYVELNVNPTTFFSAIHCMYTLLNFRSLVMMFMIVMMIMIIILRMTTSKLAAAETATVNFYANG